MWLGVKKRTAKLWRRHDRPTVFVDKHYSNNRHVRSLRKFVEVLDQRHSSVSIVGLLLHTAMELASVICYVWVSETSRATSVSAFRWGLPLFVVEVVLNIIFLLEWVALFFFEEDKKAYLVSWLSLVNALTSIPMIVLGIGALRDPKWLDGWVPMYLRVWWVYECLCLLLDYPQFADFITDVKREVARFFVRVAAVLCTCIGTSQIVQSTTHSYLNIFDSLYMMVVTFGTIGYGDVTPLSSIGRLIMCAFMIVGVCFFLPMFQRLAEIAERYQYYNTFSGGGSMSWLRSNWSHPHVIICGHLTNQSVELLLRNFYAGWRKYLDTSIVLMSPEEHTPEVRLTTNLPWLKGRVTLMVGDPAKAADLDRAKANRADAIFLFGNSKSTAYYEDFTIIAQSMAVSLYDPNLPQLLLLRRNRTVKQIAPYAASVLEAERSIHHLLGLSMVHPGVVPLIVNLLRTYEPLPVSLTLSRHWVEQYEYSLRNDVHGLDIPDALRGREFRVLARAYYEKDVTLIGILTMHHVVQLNPRELIPNAKKLILIARTDKVAQDVTDEIARNYEQAFGEEMLLAPDPDEHDLQKRRNMLLHSSGSDTLEISDMLRTAAATPSPEELEPVPRLPYVSSSTAVDEPAFRERETSTMTRTCSAAKNNGHSLAPQAAEEDIKVDSLMRIEDALDFENHFVVIELSSAKAKDRSSRYAQESANTAAAHDIFHVIMPVRQAYPDNDVILLTNDVSFGPYLDYHWKVNQQDMSNPVKYINGCGLNTADLRRCNLEQCAGCCIFYAGDISRSGSTSAMSMLVVLSINEILQGVPSFPVVVELEGLANLSLFPPYAEDPRLRSQAEIDFAFEPNFVIGNAVSRLMLYPALQRTYFMEEFIDVMDVLISGHSPTSPALARLPLRLCEVELATYEDVVTYCLQFGFLPIALQRRIVDLKNPSLNGQRFVLTNPPHALPVLQQSDILFYIAPG